MIVKNKAFVILILGFLLTMAMSGMAYSSSPASVDGQTNGHDDVSQPVTIAADDHLKIPRDETPGAIPLIHKQKSKTVKKSSTQLTPTITMVPMGTVAPTPHLQ